MCSSGRCKEAPIQRHLLVYTSGKHIQASTSTSGAACLPSSSPAPFRATGRRNVPPPSGLNGRVSLAAPTPKVCSQETRVPSFLLKNGSSSLPSVGKVRVGQGKRNFLHNPGRSLH